MKKQLFLTLFLLLGSASYAQRHHREIFRMPKPMELAERIRRIEKMPDGIQIVYNGKGTSVFDILYTIEKTDSEFNVYKGDKNYFNRIYSIKRTDETYRLYGGYSNSLFDVTHTLEVTNSGYTLYKGHSTGTSDIIYTSGRRNPIKTLEFSPSETILPTLPPNRDFTQMPQPLEFITRIRQISNMPDGIQVVYNGKGTSVFDILYTIEKTASEFNVYKGDKNYFNRIYSIKRTDDIYKLYKGESDSVFSVVNTLQMKGNGYTLYKGDSTRSFDVLYTYE